MVRPHTRQGVTYASGVAVQRTFEAWRLRVRRSQLVRPRRGGARGYESRDFVEGSRTLGVAPHLAQNTTHRSGRIDGRTTRRMGDTESHRKRKRTGKIFGWMKMVGPMRKPRRRGRRKVALPSAKHHRTVGTRRCVRHALAPSRPAVNAVISQPASSSHSEEKG